MAVMIHPNQTPETLVTYRHACAHLSTLWRLRNLPTLARELGEDEPADDAMWDKAIQSFFESQQAYYKERGQRNE